MAQDADAVPSSIVKPKILRQCTELALREGGTVVDKKFASDFWTFLEKTETKAAKGKLKLKKFPDDVQRSLGAIQTYEYSEWKLKRKSKLSNEQSKDLDLLFKFATRAAELDYGCDDWNDVSLASTSQFYTGTDGVNDADFLPVNQKGYVTLIQNLASKLPDGCIKLHHPCSNVNWVGPRVELEFEDGSSTTVEHVIVTVPLGFLKKRVNNFFSPPLPITKTLAFDGLGNKFWLALIEKRKNLICV